MKLSDAKATALVRAGSRQMTQYIYERKDGSWWVTDSKREVVLNSPPFANWYYMTRFGQLEKRKLNAIRVFYKSELVKRWARILLGKETAPWAS